MKTIVAPQISAEIGQRSRIQVKLKQNYQKYVEIMQKL